MALAVVRFYGLDAAGESFLASRAAGARVNEATVIKF